MNHGAEIGRRETRTAVPFVKKNHQFAFSIPKRAASAAPVIACVV